jgi:hypothetical protein
MKAWISFTLVLALGCVSVARAECVYPKSPDAPPNGATATLQEMIAAKHAFDAYNTAMNTYLDCLNLEMDVAAPKDPSKLTPDDRKLADQQQRILTQKHNAAFDELQAVIGRFNEQLRIFKARPNT